MLQFSKWKVEFTVSESNSWIYFIYIIYLNKNWKMYWLEQSFTGLGLEDKCSSWGLLYYGDPKRCISNVTQCVSRNIINVNTVVPFLQCIRPLPPKATQESPAYNV